MELDDYIEDLFQADITKYGIHKLWVLVRQKPDADFVLKGIRKEADDGDEDAIAVCKSLDSLDNLTQKKLIQFIISVSNDHP